MLSHNIVANSPILTRICRPGTQPQKVTWAMVGKVIQEVVDGQRGRMEWEGGEIEEFLGGEGKGR